MEWIHLHLSPVLYLVSFANTNMLVRTPPGLQIALIVLLQPVHGKPVKQHIAIAVLIIFPGIAKSCCIICDISTPEHNVNGCFRRFTCHKSRTSFVLLQILVHHSVFSGVIVLIKPFPRNSTKFALRSYIRYVAVLSTEI